MVAEKETFKLVTEISVFHSNKFFITNEKIVKYNCLGLIIIHLMVSRYIPKEMNVNVVCLASCRNNFQQFSTPQLE